MSEPSVEELIAKLFAETPDAFACWLALGEGFLEMERFREALRALERAHELDPRNLICAAKLREARAELAKMQ